MSLCMRSLGPLLDSEWESKHLHGEGWVTTCLECGAPIDLPAVKVYEARPHMPSHERYARHPSWTATAWRAHVVDPLNKERVQVIVDGPDPMQQSTWTFRPEVFDAIARMITGRGATREGGEMPSLGDLAAKHRLDHLQPTPIDFAQPWEPIAPPTAGLLDDALETLGIIADTTGATLSWEQRYKQNAALARIVARAIRSTREATS